MSLLCFILLVVGLCLFSKSKILGFAVCGAALMFFFVAVTISGGVNAVLDNDLKIAEMILDKIKSGVVYIFETIGKWIADAFIEVCNWFRTALSRAGMV